MGADFLFIVVLFVLVEATLAFGRVGLSEVFFFCSLEITLINFLAISLELERTTFEIDFAAFASMVDKRPNTSSWISDSITF